MSLASPEASTPKPVTTLKGSIIEISGYGNEITVAGENVGTQLWGQLVTDSQRDLKERYSNVLYNRRGKKFETTGVIVGLAAENNSDHANMALSPRDLMGGIRGLFSQTVAHIHTHPMPSELDHLKTSIPSTADITLLSNPGWGGSMVILDRGGVHLLIRTGESMRRDEPPPPDLIENILKEVGDVNGTVVDIQRRINGLISQFGISYYYRESLTPNEDGTVTFKKP